MLLIIHAAIFSEQKNLPCWGVLNAAKKIKDPAHFGLHPHLIEHLNLCIENYIAFKDIPLKVVKDHARAMRLADRLTKQCINILQKQVDPLMVVIDTTETGKLSHYYSIRKICKPAGRKRKYIKKEKNTEQQISQVSQPQVPKITRKPKLLNLSVLQV
jgi:hypothetical protein